MFSFGTVVYVTKGIAKKTLLKFHKIELPEIPSHLLRSDNSEQVLKERHEYYLAKFESLKNVKLRLLYLAAVQYLTDVGYPLAGHEESNRLIRLHDGSIWSSQFRTHFQAINYIPKSESISNALTFDKISGSLGVRMDQFTLIPIYIHSSPEYNEIERGLDQKIWDDMNQAGIYDNPETTGLRVFSFKPFPTESDHKEVKRDGTKKDETEERL